MPAIKNGYKANGANSITSTIGKQMMPLDEQDAIASKKLQLLEEDQMNQREKLSNARQTSASVSSDAQTFHDTYAQPTIHVINKSSSAISDDEQILIYDGQNNTSLAQTAKDQFAAALLRLQSGLELSSKRLSAVESKVDDFIKQQQQRNQLQTRLQQQSDAKGSETYLLNYGTTLLYLGWPIVVFLAMRAVERKQLSSITVANSSC